MSNSHYNELDRLISEYEKDVKLIKDDKLIMKNYPKLFVMSVASLFEHEVKCLLENFYNNPIAQIPVAYPKIDRLARGRGNKPIEDRLFAKFESYENNAGSLVLNAEEFYELFGGISFRSVVCQNYELERINRLQKEEQMLSNLVTLLGENEQYEEDYAKHCDIKERLERCTFERAEQAYLSLKLRRNKVAHNYIFGLLDSFEDVRNFYYDAILYIIGLEKAILSITRCHT